MNQPATIQPPSRKLGNNYLRGVTIKALKGSAGLSRLTHSVRGTLHLVPAPQQAQGEREED